MTELLKKGVKFVWSEECDKAFHTFREHLTSAPVLTQSDMSKPFVVFCDASGTGLGCVLMQENRVIAYASIANMASYAISSSLILVIHDNMIIGTNPIVLACLCRHF
jgi:hypothetical protein